MHPSLRIVIVVAVLALCGYLAWLGFSGPGAARELPQGVQTLTGTLVPAELSLTRRGTHALKVDGEDVAYVESASVNLRLYELTEVGVTGAFTHNTDPSDLPVLVATSVRAIEIPAVSVDLPTVGLTLKVPESWEYQVFDDGVAFGLTGSTTPFLRIMKTSLTRLPDEGTPMFIGGYDAVRVQGKDGQSFFVQGGRIILSFTWTSRDEAQSAAFAQMLRTAIVRSASSSSSQRTMTGGVFVLPSSAASGSDASAGKPKPCGGPAGVLCPAGTYCAVTEADGVGTCVPLR